MQIQYAIVGSNCQDTYGDMMKKLRKIGFFGCQQVAKNKRGRPQKTYIDQLIEGTGLKVEELKTFMANREEWKSFINSTLMKRFDQ